MNETELLRRFADDHDEEAFAELVRGKIISSTPRRYGRSAAMRTLRRM